MPATSNEHHAAQEVRDKAREVQQNLRDLGAAARHTAEESFCAAREKASEYVAEGRNQAVALSHTVEQQIRQQPMRAILIAAGVGFLIGACFMRR